MIIDKPHLQYALAWQNKLNSKIFELNATPEFTGILFD